MKSMNRKILVVIPARGDSKGLPGKNIKPLCGKPMIAWTIEAMRKSGVPAEIAVSTEDPKIAKVVRRFGIECSELRPASLATDTATTDEVVLYELGRLEKKGERFDIVIKLQPTSPLRDAEDIRQAIALLDEKGAQAIVSICQAETHPYWINSLPPSGNMGKFIKPEVLASTRQMLPSAYRLNGAIYLAKVPYFKEFKTFFSGETYAYVMPQERSVDVDTDLDFKLAGVMLSARKLVKPRSVITRGRYV